MKSNETFASRFLLICGSNVILQALGFLYRILLSRFAGTEGLGVYRLAASIYSVLHATCLSGVTLAGTRFASSWKAERKEGAVSALVPWIFLVFGSLFVSLSFIVWFGRFYISEHLIGDMRVLRTIPIMLICLLLTSIENIFKAVMIGLERVDHAAVSELSEQIVRTFAVLILLKGFATNDLGRTAILIFCASVISEIVSAAMMTGMYLSMLRFKYTAPPQKFRAAVCKTVFPVSAAACFNNLIASAGAVVLPKRLSASGMSSQQAVSELGAFSGVTAPIMTLPMALIASLCTVTLPEVSARTSFNNRHQMLAFSEKIFRTVGLIGIPFTALLLPIAPVISRLFFYHAVPASVFVLTGLSCILCYYQMIAGCILNGCGKQTWNVIVITCAEILQLFLVWHLTSLPTLRIYGYILAQCIASLFAVICNSIKLHRSGIVHIRMIRLLLEPCVCGLLLFLWVRIFLVFYTGFVGQWPALILTILSSLVFYVLLLRLLDVDLVKYLSKTPAASSVYPMFY